jgi:hypothetical protein
VPFAGGAAALGVLGVLGLLATGSLGEFFEQMAWLQKNYSGVNIMPYGSVIGGYGALFQGTSGAGPILITAVLVLCIALPAILPVSSLALWGAAMRKSREDRAIIALLLVAAIALVITTVPRSDVMHLAFIAALPYSLTAAGIARVLPVRAAAVLAIASVSLSALFATNHFRGVWGAPVIASAAGPLRVPPENATEFAELTAAVQPGDGVFVYPYMPLLYTITQGANPTRFSYLAPGMMTTREEMQVVDQLKAKPPDWLLYLHVPPEEIARVFPSAARTNLRFEQLEQWLMDHYIPAEPKAGWSGYQLWRRKLDSIAELN